MFENQPKGLYALALANTGERFGYYTMLAVFALFLRANFGLDPGTAGLIYSSFLGLVYFLPLVGGILICSSPFLLEEMQSALPLCWLPWY